MPWKNLEEIDLKTKLVSRRPFFDTVSICVKTSTICQISTLHIKQG